jgi:hypothetical protein
MSRIVQGLFVVALAVPALAAAGPEEPAAPAKQYQALVKQYQDAMQAYSEALGKAQTFEERQKVFAEVYPKPENNAAIGPIAGWIVAIAGPFPGPSPAAELLDRAAVIKPGAGELAWLKIPWVLDLKAAQRTAKAEGRPILLWVTGDDPLGRC